jgi:hypothetical protein
MGDFAWLAVEICSPSRLASTITPLLVAGTSIYPHESVLQIVEHRVNNSHADDTFVKPGCP